MSRRLLSSPVHFIPLISALLATSVQAAGVADTPGAVQPAASINFTQYDCANAREKAQSSHIGQVINDVYHEWVQSYDEATQGPLIHCVTLVRPTASQLSASEAARLLEESRNITPTISPRNAGQGEKKAASAAVITLKQVTALPVGTTVAMAADAVSESDVSERTKPQELNRSGAGPDDYTVLDLGFGDSVASQSDKKDIKSGMERAAAIGVDDRARVGDKTVLPWFLIGQVIVTWKDGTQAICTGTLVSAHVVLTAGQCAHNRERGGFASKVSFTPGQGQASASSAVTQISPARYADYVETNGRWTQISGGQTIQTLDARSDYAALYFIAPWTLATTYMPVLYGHTASSNMNVAGYPTEAGGGKFFNQDMWYSSGTETSRSITLLRAFQVREFSADVSAGQSGAPFWTFDGTTRGIVGVVSYGGDEVAGGAWFGGDNQAIVTAFVNWSPSQSGPAHIADNLRVPMVFPSGDLSTASYLRLYNSTPQAGTVVVRFLNGDTGAYIATWTSPTIRPFASRQFTVPAIEGAASPPINPAGRTRYTLDISSNFLGFFQHVLWNRVGLSLTNLSGCGNGISNDVLHMNGVHSSRIPDYPSVVYAHNLGKKAADITISIYDADTGTRIGGIVIPAVPPNASAAFRMGEVETALSFVPAATQFHYNLVQEGDFPGYLQHVVYNTGAGVITNMTAKCAFPAR